MQLFSATAMQKACLVPANRGRSVLARVSAFALMGNGSRSPLERSKKIKAATPNGQPEGVQMSLAGCCQEGLDSSDPEAVGRRVSWTVRLR